MGVTIKHVAEKAGVSPATVSFVLNNRPGIAESTRKEVLKAVEELNYQIPSSLRQKKTNKMISFLKIARHGHIINRDHNVFISDYIDGIQTAAREEGYSLEVRNYPEFSPDKIMEELQENPVEGVVVLATELDEEGIPLLEDLPMPVVFIDNSHPYSSFDFVDMDNEGAVFSIVNAMKEYGHRKIGIVKAAYETRNFKLREDSFYKAMHYYGLAADKSWQYEVDSTFENAFNDMKRLLNKSNPLPTALFCVCDIIAYGVLKALREKGLRVPEDVTLIGFDDLPSSQFTDPPLASIKVSKRRIGRRAFQLLKRRMNAESQVPYEKVNIGSELIIRQSLGSHNAK